MPPSTLFMVDTGRCRHRQEDRRRDCRYHLTETLPKKSKTSPHIRGEIVFCVGHSRHTKSAPLRDALCITLIAYQDKTKLRDVFVFVAINVPLDLAVFFFLAVFFVLNFFLAQLV